MKQIRGGFSLAELLITMGLISLISSLLLGIWLSSRRVVEKTEGKLTVQARVCEPAIRLSHWLNGALSHQEDSPLRLPSEGQRGAVLEFYSCDRLVGDLPEVDPRHPDNYLYRVQAGKDDSLWLQRVEAGLVKAQRQVGEHVRVNFYNVDNRTLEVQSSAQVELRSRSEEFHLSTFIAIPHVD